MAIHFAGEPEPTTQPLLTLAAETASTYSPREPASGSERILDADEVAAELMIDAPVPQSRPPSPPPPRAAAQRSVRQLAPPPPAPRSLPPTAADLTSRLELAEGELTRLRRQMRARDAYLAELERALEASTSKLEASGIGSLEDAHKLLGRVRGQAFRIAELESELRQLEQRLSRLARLLPAGYAS